MWKLALTLEVNMLLKFFERLTGNIPRPPRNKQQLLNDYKLSDELAPEYVFMLIF